MQLGCKSRFLNESVVAVQGSPCIAVIHHPLCVTGLRDVQTSFTTAEAVERRPFSGPRPFVFDTEVPRKRHFLWKFTSVLLLAKTRVNELLRVLALGNGRGETLNVFQLLPSFLPSVPLFPSFFFCKFFRASILHVR